MSPNQDLVASVLTRMGYASEKKDQLPTAVESMESSTNSSDGSNVDRVKQGGRRLKKAEPKFPTEPRVIQVIKRPKTYMNHSYRDFSSVPSELDYVEETDIKKMTFAEKVHHILSNPEYQEAMTWMPHGRAFKIVVPKRLETDGILAKYFGHNRYSSFLRQLNNHGFKHITQGIDRNCYYHEFMLLGRPHLCKYMPDPKDARRLVPDPDNEPDFYRISQSYPLSDAAGDMVNQSALAPKSSLPVITSGSQVKRASSWISDAANDIPPAKRPHIGAEACPRDYACISAPLLVSPALLPSSALGASVLRTPVAAAAPSLGPLASRLDVAKACAAINHQAAMSSLQNQLILEQERRCLLSMRQPSSAALAVYSDLLITAKHNSMSNFSNYLNR